MRAHPTTFGKLLRQLRTEANLTRRELAERSGVSPRTIADLERGVSQAPLPYTMRRLTEALQLESDTRRVFEATARGQAPSSALSSALDNAQNPILDTLPSPAAPFIGRTVELQALDALLQRPVARLLTLFGPGGAGKSRIAIEAARAAAIRYSDGVAFVPLASLADPDLLIPTVAHVLGIRESTGERIGETLLRWLRPRNVLLVLDNLEHLTEGAARLTQLLEDCPALTVLVTSRVVLHLSGEYLFPVSPMSLPPDETIEPEDLARYDATALFIERACAANSDFTVTRETAPLITAICARVDGLPLAIELAAAQSRFFQPAALLKRLSSEAEALGTGPRDVPARQHTLRATIDWSYRLLSPEEQRLFARLSIFAGGCTLAAVQAVCGSEAEQGVEVRLERLLDSSLVEREAAEVARVTMSDIIREYAAERLQEMGEEEEIRKRHATVFRTLADEAGTKLMGSQQGQWLARLETEHDNLRAALAWLLEHDVDGALEMCHRLSQFWRLRGYWQEGVTWLEAALARGRNAPVLLRGRALASYGWLWFYRAEYQRAFALLEESLPLLRDSGADLDVGGVLYALGFMHMETGDPTEAQSYLDESLDYFGDPGGIGERSATLASLSSLAHMRGDYEQAVKLAEEAVTCAQQSGVTTRVMYALGDLGTAATGLGDYPRAEAALEEALIYSQQLGVPAMSGACLANLGELAWEQGDFERAESYQVQAVEAARRMGDVHVAAIGHTNLAKVLVSRGNAPSAVACLRDGLWMIRQRGGEKWITGLLLSMFAQALSAGGRAQAALSLGAVSSRILNEVGYTPPPREREMGEELMDQARAMLDKPAREEAREAGEAMTLEEAVEFALVQSDPEAPTALAHDA